MIKDDGEVLNPRQASVASQRYREDRGGLLTQHIRLGTRGKRSDKGCVYPSFWWFDTAIKAIFSLCSRRCSVVSPVATPPCERIIGVATDTCEPGPVPAACGCCMPICSSRTEWTSGSKVGAARIPSSAGEFPGDDCRVHCFTFSMPRRRRNGLSDIGGTEGCSGTRLIETTDGIVLIAAPAI
jgi:hypothetical protein